MNKPLVPLLALIFLFLSGNALADFGGICGQRDGCGRYQWTIPPYEKYYPPPVHVPSPQELANARAMEINEQGLAAFYRRDYREAMRLYELALQAGPNDANAANIRRNLGIAHNDLGVEFYDKRDWQEALKWFQMAQEYYSSQVNVDNIANARAAIEGIANEASAPPAILPTIAEVAAEEAARKEAQLQADLATANQRAATRLANLRDDLAEKPSDDCSPSQDASVVDLCFPETIDSEPKSLDFESGAELGPEDKKAIGTMIALVQKQGWSKREQDRLNLALRNLSLNVTPNEEEVQRVWNGMEARGPSSAPAQDAAGGEGPVLYRPGQRQQSHEDCAIYALASAADLPYSVVAARAGELLRQAEWRDSVQRNDPQKIFDGTPEEPGGLYAGEVAILAEAFGQAEIIRPSDFSKTLKAGRPVIIGVELEGGGGHEVVLSKTFKHKGVTWYEMLDSNQKDPLRRLYLSAAELDGILLDNGLAFRPEPGRTPKLLK